MTSEDYVKAAVETLREMPKMNAMAQQTTATIALVFATLAVATKDVK